MEAKRHSGKINNCLMPETTVKIKGSGDYCKEMKRLIEAANRLPHKDLEELVGIAELKSRR